MLAFCGASAFALNYAEINVNDRDLELSGKLDMGQMINSVTPDTVFLGLKYLNGHAKHSEHDNADVKYYAEFNFLMQKEIQNSGLTVGLGIKLNRTELGNLDFISAPLGIEASYKIPATQYIPMYIGGEIYHAPSVLSFEDAETFMEYRVHFDLEVIQNGRITVGYRSMDTNYNQADFHYNRSIYAGFKFGF